MAKRNKNQLPADILLSIVDFVCPSTPYPIALPPPHTITKTLLSLTLTSRIIYPTARRLLYTYCFYIHTEQKFLKLLGVFSPPLLTNEPSLHPSIENLLPHITSLYLKPYRSYDSIEESPIHYEIQQLLTIFGLSLRRLLIDIPLRSLYPEDDLHGIRPILRSAFSNLPNLEEFCSVQDELYLATQEKHSEEPPVWSLWPKLKKLVLYNQDVSMSSFWIGLRKLENIETVVLTRADGLEEVDMKEEWRNQFHGKAERPLDVILVNVQAEHRVPMGRDGWKQDDKMKVKELNVPISYYGDEDLIVLCKLWTKRRVLHGYPVGEWN